MAMSLHVQRRLPKAQGDHKFWDGIVAGDIDTMRTEFVGHDELPKVIDPPTSWCKYQRSAVDWNYPMVLDPANFPRRYELKCPSQRAFNAHVVRSRKSAMTTVRALKRSTLELADRILDDPSPPLQYGSATAKRAAVALRNWDRQAESSSRGTLTFQAFARKFMGPAGILGGFAVPFDLKHLTTPAASDRALP
jgi:acyl-homoserine-lactone acylase